LTINNAGFRQGNVGVDPPINGGGQGPGEHVGDGFPRLGVGFIDRVEQLDDFVDKIHHRPLGRETNI